MATLTPLVLQSSQLQPFCDFLLSSIAFHTQKEQDVSSDDKPQLLFHRLEALRLRSTLALMQTDEGKAAVSAPSKEDKKEERLTTASVTTHKAASSSSAPATDKKRKEGRSGTASRRPTAEQKPLQEPNEKPVTSPPLGGRGQGDIPPNEDDEVAPFPEAKRRHSGHIKDLVAKFGGPAREPVAVAAAPGVSGDEPAGGRPPPAFRVRPSAGGAATAGAGAGPGGSPALNNPATGGAESVRLHALSSTDVSSDDKPQLLFHRLEALRLRSTLALMQTDEGKAAVSASSKEDKKEERLTTASVTTYKAASSSSAPATDKKRKEGRSGTASRRPTAEQKPLQEPNEKPVTSPPLGGRGQGDIPPNEDDEVAPFPEAKRRHSGHIKDIVAKFGGSPALNNPATGGAESVRLHALSSTDRSPRPLVIATGPQVTGPEAKSVSPAAPSEHEKPLCQACLEEVVLVHFLASKECSHPARYCGVCRAAAYAAKVEQGQRVVCDYPDCKMQAIYKDYREVLIGADRKDLMESVATLMDREFPKKTAVSALTLTTQDMESVFCCECNEEYPAGGTTIITCSRPGCGATTCVRHKRKTFSKVTQKEKHAQFCCEIGEFEQASQQEKQERFQELIESERWKEDNCRLCPHCGRLVNKLDGCDHMKCGQDYHGGNVQSGCGGDFKWSQTEPYRSATLQSPSTAEAPSAATAAATGWTCQDCRAHWESSAEYCRNCYWVCSACTMHNALVMEYCEACQNQRNL